MSGKKKKKGEFTYVGVSPKNWREKVRENNKRGMEFLKKHNIKPTPKSVGNPNPMFKSVGNNKLMTFKERIRKAKEEEKKRDPRLK